MVLQQEPVIEANLTDKVGPKTRKDRLAQQKEKIERIVHYLRHGQHQDGLTKNQQRVVRGQAKKYSFDETSNVFYSNCLKIILQSAFNTQHSRFLYTPLDLTLACITVSVIFIYKEKRNKCQNI